MRKVSLPLLLVVFGFQARTANNFAMSIDNIMRGPELYGYEPSQVRWSSDSQTIYFQWKQYSDKIIAPLDTYAVGRDGSNLRKLSDEEARNLPAATGDTTRDQKLMAYASAGDLYVLDNTTGTVRQLTKTSDNESAPKFTRDGKRISFVRGGNLYVMPLEGGTLVQVTDIRPAAAAGVAPTEASGRGGRGGLGGGGGRGGRGVAATTATGEPPHRTARHGQPGVSQEATERTAYRGSGTRGTSRSDAEEAAPASMEAI